MEEARKDRVFQVLQVEDDQGDVFLTRMAFEKECHRWPVHLHHVDCGECCLDFLYRRNGYEDAPRPDLILMDHKLPILTGLETMEQIAVDPKLRGIPVVMFTNSLFPGDIERAYSLGCSGYVNKPVDMDAMARMICGIFTYWFEVTILP